MVSIHLHNDFAMWSNESFARTSDRLLLQYIERLSLSRFIKMFHSPSKKFLTWKITEDFDYKVKIEAKENGRFLLPESVHAILSFNHMAWV